MHGPLLSGDLGRLMAAELGLSNAASRKQLSRYTFPVRRLSGFFSNNQAFFYLPDHVADGSFGEVFLEAIKSSAKRLHVLICALQYNKGYLHTNEIAAYSFSPTENLRGHKRFDVLIKDALRLNIIQVEGDYYKLSNQFFPGNAIDFRYAKAISIARNFLLNQFADWSRMIGMVSFESVEFYREFSKFHWAFSAPSYVGTLPQTGEDGMKPAFVLGDVVIGNEVANEHVQFFIEKFKIVKSLKGHSRIMPFLIVDVIPKESLVQLKQLGVVVGFVFKLFGSGYSELVKTLIQTVNNAGAILKKNPESFLQLMDRINTLTEGKTNNLRGDVFELAVGYYHARKSRHFDVGKKIYVDGQPYELDVFAVYADRVVIAECKGTKSGVTLGELDDWLSKIIDLRRWIDMQEAYDGKRHEFEFWSTGGFTNEAQKKILVVSRAKKYGNHYLDKDAIILKAKETGTSKFVNILNQYFLKEPV
jgi:hypothetical protein